MITKLIIAILKDIVRFLKKQPNFFQALAEDREKALESENIHIPNSIKNYLVQISAENFQKDVKQIVFYTLHPKKWPKSALLEAFTIYCILELPMLIDSQKSGNMPESYLKKTIIHILKSKTYQEIGREINLFLEHTKNKTHIIIQSPRPITGESRGKMRAELLKKFPISFPIFQTKPELIGGLRILINSHLKDLSWLTKVNQIHLIAT